MRKRMPSSNFYPDVNEHLIYIFVYWIPKLHKISLNQRYTVGTTKFTIKPLSQLLFSILTAVKEGPQSYHDTCYFRSILKHYTSLVLLKRWYT